MWFAVPTDIAVAFKSAVMENSGNIIKTYNGTAPEGTVFSLAFEGHAASWIERLYSSEEVDKILSSHAFHNQKEDGTWGKKFEATPKILDVEIFPYRHFDKPAEGLIIHYGADKTLPQEDARPILLALEDAEVQGIFMKMRAQWIITAEGVIDLSPRGLKPIAKDTFVIDRIFAP